MALAIDDSVWPDGNEPSPGNYLIVVYFKSPPFFPVRDLSSGALGPFPEAVQQLEDSETENSGGDVGRLTSS